jgi:hypothetical protein
MADQLQGERQAALGEARRNDQAGLASHIELRIYKQFFWSRAEGKPTSRYRSGSGRVSNVGVHRSAASGSANFFP